MRHTAFFNDNWTFTKEGVSEQVTIPHTWNAIDGQGTAQYYRGVCTYEKTFDRPEMKDGDQVYLEFRGANSSATVEVNGKELMTHDGGYSTFRVNITDVLADQNTVKVSVDNSPNDRVYPQRADFTFYGGIYRDVYIITVDENHFDLDSYGSKGFMITPNLDGDKAVIDFKTYSVGQADKIVVAVEGVGEAELAIGMENGKQVATGSLTIENVHRWDGLDDPYLYTATASLYKNGEVVDEVADRFGCREYSFDPEKGFFLNGRSYPLHGVSRHQDRKDMGNALTTKEHDEDMDLILEVGANSIRLAHYQHDQYFYDLCDEKGIIAWAEIPFITVFMPNGRENTISQMKELISQNYNHASIICWAISNEITLEGVTDELMDNHKVLNDLIHEMDPKRVSAMANLFLLETDSPLVQLPDIRGYNLYYGWYVGEMEDNDEWFDEFHRNHPDTVIGLTEYGADSVITKQSPKPVKGDYTESYMSVYHEHMLEMFSTRPYLWGTYVWNMFEFAAAGRDEAGDPGKNHKGLITFDRKQKKDAFYIYKAWWSDEPFVHLCGRRYHDRVEDTTEIKVYSNQKSVTLYVDGKEVGTVNGEHVFKFEVPISGTHTIKAVSGDLTDEMEIAKTNEPNPDYFADPLKVKNWFDEDESEGDINDNYLSVNSTMAEIKASPEGAALLQRMMAAQSDKTGMAAGAKIPAAMQKMIERQPLKKLMAQGGMEVSDEMIAQLNAALQKIKKVK
ncbi:MAG: glycoside hydrolase family 2 protein [Lachnospiraceae bacterium]|nr:glycoside hydrolase family 2 protein [Lachnospiraceae bacterium]